MAAARMSGQNKKKKKKKKGLDDEWLQLKNTKLSAMQGQVPIVHSVKTNSHSLNKDMFPRFSK
jgi:hypothetical protein